MEADIFLFSAVWKLQKLFPRTIFQNLMKKIWEFEMALKKKKEMESMVVADDITRDCNDFEVWFIQHGKLIAWGCVAIIVAVAVIFSVIQIRKNMAAESLATLAAATTQAQLEDALKKYPTGAAACEARARLARIYLNAKNSKGALEQFALIAADESAPVFTKGRAILDSGYLYENEKKYKEALAQYEKAVADIALGEDVRCEAYYAAGRMQVIDKNYAKARAAFRQANIQNPTSMASMFWKNQAQAALERLPVKAPVKK